MTISIATNNNSAHLFMKKLYSTILLAAFATAAMAQNYLVGKPNNDSYRYLDEYHNLKEYIDYAKYPNFKLGIGTTVSDYLNNAQIRDMTNNNFTETVAGNAMKMASCVSNNGTMNFTTVKNYVNRATEAGLNVYGHTLAWHSQQANGWLRGLLADKPAEDITDGDATVLVSVASKDFRTQQNVGWKSDENTYGYKLNFSSSDGLNIHCTKKCTNSWDVQFLAMTEIQTVSGKTYKMTMLVRGTSDGKLHTKLGDFNGGSTKDVSFTTEWKEVSVDYKATMASSFYMLQCGDFVGDIYIKNIKFEESKNGKTVSEPDRRYLKAHATEKHAENYDNQIWLVPGSFNAGSSFVFQADVRADKDATASTQIHTVPGSYVHYEALGNVPFTTEWKTITLRGSFSKAGQSIAFNLNDFVDENNYYFDNVSLKINGVETIVNGDFEGTDVSSFKVKEYGGGINAPVISEGLTYVLVPSTVPLTPEERHDVLVEAMEKWISGMMNACDGKVKAWDVVNEAISGGGNDGEGNYTLQHSEGYNSGTWDVGGDAFYWQDYMGDLEYVRQAVRLAREYGPDDVKLFINDYNLESDWDNNKKVQSLINWIKKWESDGVTKIDGIGTQMHISYYENSGTQTSKKNAITNMFKLMAATGKLVRVSEMDMGYVNASGNNVSTSSMTETQHKNMADFYEWIIKEYLRLVPADQQWGICQWCPTDSPANSGWRANTPVGIWDLSYYRKHAYAGFVRGLGGMVQTGIGQTDAKASRENNGWVYDLQGRHVAESTDMNSLPAGLYIVGGKKVAIRK